MSSGDVITEICKLALSMIRGSVFGDFYGFAYDNDAQPQYNILRLSRTKSSIRDVLKDISKKSYIIAKLHNRTKTIYNDIYESIPREISQYERFDTYTDYWFKMYFNTDNIAYEFQKMAFDSWTVLLFLGFQHGYFVNFCDLYKRYPELVDDIYNHLLSTNTDVTNVFTTDTHTHITLSAQQLMFKTVFDYIANRKGAFTELCFTTREVEKNVPLSIEEEDYFKKAFVCYAIPFYEFALVAKADPNNNKLLHFYPKPYGERSFYIENKGSISNLIYGFQRTYGFFNETVKSTSYPFEILAVTDEDSFQIAEQLLTFREEMCQANYENTLRTLIELKIIGKKDKFLLSSPQEAKQWMIKNYTMDYFIGKININKVEYLLNAWYAFVALGYHQNTCIFMDNEVLQAILKVYNKINDTYKPLLIHNVDDFYLILNHKSKSRHWNHDERSKYIKFFDDMLLRPFLKWVHEENVLYPIMYLKHLRVPENMTEQLQTLISTYTRNKSSSLLDQEVIVHRYRLLHLLFTKTGVKQFLPSRKVNTPRDAMNVFTKIVKEHRLNQERVLSRNYETIWITFGDGMDSSFKTVFKICDSNSNLIASFRNGMSTGDGVKRHWFSMEYTSENVLLYLRNLKKYTPISRLYIFWNILKFGYRHHEGLKIKKPLFDYLVVIYKNTQLIKGNIKLDFEFAKSMLWYFINNFDYSIESPLSIDLFLEAQYNVDFNVFCQTYDTDTKIRESRTDIVKETLEMDFNLYEAFFNTIFVNKNIYSYNENDLKNELAKEMEYIAPYFSNHNSKTVSYIQCLFEHFDDSTITFESIVSTIKVIPNEYLDMSHKDQIKLYTDKMIDIISKYNNDEEKLKQFVLTVTGESKVPPYIQINPKIPSTISETLGSYSSFSIHTCTREIDFPSDLLDQPSELLSNEILLYLPTFNILGGGGSMDMDMDMDKDSHRHQTMTVIVRSIVMTFVLGLLFDMIHTKSKQDKNKNKLTKKDIWNISLGCILLVMYICILLLQSYYKISQFQGALLYIVDIFACIYILWIVMNRK
jgi:hypothetical protein